MSGRDVEDGRDTGGSSPGTLFSGRRCDDRDGLLTALRLMDIIVRSGRSLTQLVGDLKVFPQKIQNVRVREKIPFAQVPEVKAAIEAAERELDGTGAW